MDTKYAEFTGHKESQLINCVEISSNWVKDNSDRGRLWHRAHLPKKLAKSKEEKDWACGLITPEARESFSSSDHEVVEYKFLRRRSSVKSKITIPGCRGQNKGTTSMNPVGNMNGVEWFRRYCLIYNDCVLQVQYWSTLFLSLNGEIQEIKKGSRRPVWMIKNLLTKFRQKKWVIWEWEAG